MIFVTGIHRSGSTFLGKIISHHSKVKYIHEPFNLEFPKVKKPITYWYHYIDSNTPKVRQIEFIEYINSFYKLDIKSIQLNYARSRSLKQYLKTTLELASRYRKKIPLIKDPIALMSTEWIYQNFHPKIIVSIRHPAAFIASIKVKNWEFDFKNLQLQGEFVETKLNKYKNQIDKYVETPPDIIEQGILIWNIVHDIIYEYQKKYKEWYFIKNEDISLNPLLEYEKIFKFLELDLNEKIRKEIIDSTTSSRPGKLKRNSKENIKSWKKRLTEEEINNIKSKTKPIWEKFYTEKDW